MLNCVLYSGLEGFVELRETWGSLGAAAQGRYFSDWAYWDAALHSFEPDPKRFIFALISDTQPLAIVPLRAERRSLRGLPVRVLALPNYHHPGLSEVVCRSGARAADVHAALLRGLRKTRWDLLDLDRMMGDTTLAEPQGAMLVEQQGTCDQMRGDECWDDVLARLSTNFRSNVSKSHSRLAKLAPSHGVASEPAELEALFEHFLRLEDAGWKGSNGTSILREPHALEFYRRLLQHYGSTRQMRIHWLKAGAEYIAMQLCVLRGDTLYMLKIAYDESMGRVSPGNALHAEVLKSRAYRWINVVGNPSWFQPWKPEYLPVMRLRIANRTPAGMLAYTGLRAARVAKPLLRRRA